MAGLLRRAPGLVPRAGAVERGRPDPQGAAVRPRGHGGQPRRGRQGVLVVPRRHADPQLAAWRYHYPQRAFPYDDLVAENAAGLDEPEYELLDTGIFDDGRFWVVRWTTPRPAPTDLCMRITVQNAGPEPATLARAAHAVVPQPLVLGHRDPSPGPRSATAADRFVAESPRSGPLRPGRGRGRRSRCSATTRPTSPACSGLRTPLRRTPRTASATTSCTARRRSTPDRLGTKAAAAFTFEVAAGVAGGPGAAAATPGRDSADLGRGRVRRDRRATAQAEADEFYADVVAAPG